MEQARFSCGHSYFIDEVEIVKWTWLETALVRVVASADPLRCGLLFEAAKLDRAAERWLSIRCVWVDAKQSMFFEGLPARQPGTERGSVFAATP